MKCIYCNNENELSVSDIIPYSMTGAKVKKRFVCKTHNSFTNDNYERPFISKLGIYRNLLGLKERDGDTVRFKADLMIGNIPFGNQTITNKTDLFGSKSHILSSKSEGKKQYFGNKEQLLKITGVKNDNIEDVALSNVVISVTHNILDLFASNESLHTVAKIAYEWHCYINEINEFQIENYNEIVSCILNNSQTDEIVKIVYDQAIPFVFNGHIRTGTNLIYEYIEDDGNLFVIFGLWDVIYYKVKICNICNYKSNICLNHVYMYHIDGTSAIVPFINLLNNHVFAFEPQKGIELNSRIIKDKLNRLGERDLSKEYLIKQLSVIEGLLNKYEKNQISFETFLGYEDDDIVRIIFIIRKLYENRSNYDHCKTFNENIMNIFNVDDKFVISNEMKNSLLFYLKEIHENGELVSVIKEYILFLNTVL